MITYYFHVSKNTRTKYGFEKNLFSITGDLIISDLKQAKILSEKINEKRKDEGSDELTTPGEVNALGLIHEIFHFIIRLYEEKENPGVISRGINNLQEHLGENELNKLFLEYINEFPPLEVYKGVLTPEDYLIGTTEDKTNKEIIFEELVLLYIENSNPATVNLQELYSDKKLSEKARYVDFIGECEEFFISERPFGPENLPLIQFLRKPIISNPDSVLSQLEFIKDNWGVYIHEKYNERLLLGIDLINEDIKLFLQHGGGKPTPPVPTYDFDKLKAKMLAGKKLTEDEYAHLHEIEKFTADTDWMPQVVMIAKNAFVWLDQLSKKYGRHIHRLDQIPDEELDRLASWNYTALWLIGIWERSSASKKIKQLTGNPEAAASAYSLYDYVIAKEIGGEEAFANLKDRAWQRGIRLSSDMVPNHTGIYSKWVTEKPDYFIQRNDPPYPGYRFTGPNLSDDNRIEVRIEDKYYSRSDAAVVFERLDSWTGDRKYIYHGNDGTSMPWNDTAQLNLLNPEVRESLIQTIMHVARKTPIIRFDAAMTLAKKHYRRLWFPKPGEGGAIPSRSEYSMHQQQFDDAFPQEFWREVVDRINAEMPNTLLLAEAFWLMEGYFVRTLGMHRVYNSAFMHMLMKEENNKYHELIKNTLDFNPEILKRYVNFMSNPDEETAVNQFGKGDKYFGVCLLLSTLPGLPMFAHGQIEGFAEKYGMEYKRAYYDEYPDDNLIHRHEYEIFPLLRQRHLFSQVKNFELYDLINEHGSINENVFAYSNSHENEKALVVYNNSYSQASGTINYSVKKANNSNSKTYVANKKLAEALNLKYDARTFYIFTDHKTKLEHIINGEDVHQHGMYFALNGYEYKLCLNFREVYDFHGDYDRLNNLLHGNGVPSIEKALQEMHLSPLHQSFSDLLNKDSFSLFEKNYLGLTKERQTLRSAANLALPDELANLLNKITHDINNISEVPLDRKETLLNAEHKFNSAGLLYKELKNRTKRKNAPGWIKESEKQLKLTDPENENVLFALLIIHSIIKENSNKYLFDKLMFETVLNNFLNNTGHNGKNIQKEIELIRTLTLNRKIENFVKEKINTTTSKKKTKQSVSDGDKLLEILNDKNIYSYIDLNEFEGIVYYSKENFENLLDWIFTFSGICYAEELIAPLFESNSNLERRGRKPKQITKEEFSKKLSETVKEVSVFIEEVKKSSDEAGYRWFELRENLRVEKKSTPVKPGKTKTVSKKKKRG